MYSREFTDPPKEIVQKGKVNFGTFKGVPSKIDIRGLTAPYGHIPLPPFLSKLTIKSSLLYFFNLEKYIGFTGFIDFKIFGMEATVLFNKETGKKNAYNNLMTVRRRFVPKNTNSGSCTSFRKSRHVRVSWGRNHEHHSLSFRLKGDWARPDANGFVYSPIQDSMHQDFLFVNPSPVKSRCRATWLSTMQVHGLVKIGNEPSDDSNGLAAMMVNRAYYQLRSALSVACALGKVKDKNLVLELSSSTLDAANSNAYNDNCLVVDGEPTALPPVYMTHTFGLNKTWTIQDTESMIDLSFNPVSINNRQTNILLYRTSYKIIYGTFEGVIVDKNGQKIPLKNFPGMIYDSTMKF